MSEVQALLSQRLKKNPHSSKMAVMAKQSANGGLTSFSGVFSVTDLSDREKLQLETILQEFSQKKDSYSDDLKELISITSEVKAINNQAAILHGERIKRAHSILTRYKDGAFTTWLLTAYGNRQTPYNFMQYYEFCEAMPKSLRPLIESMPRQVVYILASREGELEKKREIVEAYDGQSKFELLCRIRTTFPLSNKDKRRRNPGDAAINSLTRLYLDLKREKFSFSKAQKETVFELLQSIKKLVN